MNTRVMWRTLVSAVVLTICSPNVSGAATIRVPADATTIQQAIDAAAGGDTVLVGPGTYYERIDFHGKAITVTSEQGPDVTVIDGQRGGIVVFFQSREGRDSVLSGFTIRGGYFLYGGSGVAISGASPTIRGNTITQNSGCEGVGVVISAGAAPRIESNRIVGNSIDLCTGGWGIGILVFGHGIAPPEIVGNDISDNTSIGATSGGGIALYGAGAVLVQGNVIARNNAGGVHACGWGGGIASINYAQATIVENVIVGNVACLGGGADWGGMTGTTNWVNNTIAGNSALYYPGVRLMGYSFNHLYNNVISAAGGFAVYCDYTPAQSQLFTANDVFSAGATAYGGNCTDQTGLNGNISLDPRFVGPDGGDYRLMMTSPAIDGGYDGAPQVPAVDLVGAPRVVDGDDDGTAHVDMGAFEYYNHAPTVSAGGDRTVTLSDACTAVVTLMASGSDADGDALTYSWTSAFGTESGQTLSVSLAPGSYPFTVTTSDGNGGLASDTIVVSVLDATPPVIASVTATPSVIPANDHKMVPVVVSPSAADQCSNAVSCHIVDVTSNEPVDGLGDGDTAPDWEITGPLTLNVRAERSGSGSGRLYTITIACTDPSGNRSTSTVIVTVPR